MARKTDYKLTEAEDALLWSVTQDAMGEAGARGARLGGDPKGIGGRIGGRLGARMTRPRSAEAAVEVPIEPRVVKRRARAAIAAKGDVIRDPNPGDDGATWGRVGSGIWDMCPALVRVAVEATATGGSRVHVRATGREGLIKQNIAGKAVDRIVEAVERPDG